MPLYVYQCECGEEVERVRSMGNRDAPLLCVCGEGMERVAFHPPRWNWGPDAATHGWFIKEARPGFTGVDPSVPKQRKKR